MSEEKYKVLSVKIKPDQAVLLDAICKALNCQPGDILEYKNEE